MLAIPKGNVPFSSPTLGVTSEVPIQDAIVGEVFCLLVSVLKILAAFLSLNYDVPWRVD